ncbi:MAG TPA: glycoside hydrolase family 27 protein [Bryobacteraceae bacterium]|nr:glycoside hydrolase family 27 protein [Bryobacteraceae bacterium]
MRRIALSLLTLAGLAGAADLAGTWQFEQAGRSGQTLVTTFVFKVDGSKFTGTYATTNQAYDVVNGVVDGTKVTFQTTDDYAIPPRITDYQGTLEGDQLTLSRAVNPQGAPGGGPPPSMTSQATRATSPEQAALDEAIAAARAGRGGRGGRGGPTPAMVCKKVSSDTVFHPTGLMTRLHQPFPPFKPIEPNGFAKTPPMGWNSWNKFHRFVDDKSVREIADAMVSSGMRDAGYIYVNIDDTWEAGRDKDGNALPPDRFPPRDKNGNILTNEKFPDMKALADYVHSKGLKLGIYSGPGPRTCAGYEASYGHEAQDAKTWAAWGIDYLKYDWCSASSVYKGAEMPSAYQEMALALRATGRPIIFSLCQYGWLNVGEWGAAAGGNLWRTTGDISDNWDSMSRIGFDNQIGREKYAGPGHWNDPDMLEIGNGGMTTTEYRTHMSLWCILAAPLLAGHDVRTMPDYIANILLNKEVIAIDQDPAGIQGTRASQIGPQGYTLEVWKKPLANGGVAVGLFNRSLDTARMTVKWSDAGIAKENPKVRDLWAHRDIPNAATEYSVNVPSHGVVMLRVE